VSPVIGKCKLEAINPQLVARVLNQIVTLGKSDQTQLHVFSLMRKIFGDAIEVFRFLTYNPVQKSFKPRVPIKEARHFNLSEVRTLLLHVEDKPYGLAIWLQLYLGLRVGELQALTWTDVDLTEGILSIRRTYVRKERIIREYPKGKCQHSHKIPLELLEMLRAVRAATTSLFVATSPTGQMLSYEWYFRSLRRYCKDLGINPVGTHGLRHSTSAMYLSYGASRDDIRQLFAHSSSSVTDRYIHHRGTNLEKVAQTIQLFPGSSPNLPQKRIERLDGLKGGMLSPYNETAFS
jgi:integrase